METIQNINDISKEVLTFLAFFDSSMIEKIPSHAITKLCEMAADSNLDFYVDVSKSFEEQKISDKGKDLIAHIYYDYIAKENEKQEILKQWELNEKEYLITQKEKYNYDNIFANTNNSTSVELIKVKKETIFQKILKLLRKVLK